MPATAGVDWGGATYTVTVATGTLPGTASGTLRLDVVDDDTILDADGSKLGGPGAGNGTYRAGPVYTIDRTAPKVKGITRLDPSPTNRDVVRFRVEFTEPVVAADFEAYVSLAGLIDPAAEAKRLEKQLADKRKSLAGVQAKLGNEKFVGSAPAEVVQQQRDLAADLENQIRTMEANLKDLQEA